MAGSRQVTIQFLGDARSFVSATGKAASATDGFSNKLKRVAKAAVIGFAGATIAAAKVAYEFADAAIQDEKAQAILAKTLHNTTGATHDQIAAVEDWIAKQGELYGVTDDDLRPALSKLAAATGSITKAQRLASLAMDVSAGTGKDLQSITLALAKAQVGSLTGLGRLGIATKDADGKTRSLADITEELTKKYQGSAAKAADTAAGKFQRVKVALSETAESIGYKLLPYANELGDWLVKDGVPGLEHLAHEAKQELGPALKDLAGWVGDNKDEMEDLGKEILGTVIPAVKTSVGFVGDAVDVFSRLPGPVKAATAEIGLAAIVVPRLTGAINTMTTTVGLNESKLTGWRKGLLGLAGVAGIGAITEGARTGNHAVSLLGDSLTGAFVGGTLGSAIPGVGTAIGAVGGAAVGAGVGLFKMHKHADEAGDSAKDATPKIDGLKDSLNQTTAASTRTTKALILQKLQEDGITTSAGQLGIATSDLIKASLGNQKAIDRVNTAWQKNGDLLDGLQNQKITEWIYGMRSQMTKAENDIKKTNAALDGTDRSATKAGNALKGVGRQRPQTDKWSALYTGDLNQAVHNTDTKTSAMRDLLSTGVGKARANMGGFKGDLLSQLRSAGVGAHTAGLSIGNSIESGVHTGLSGIISNTVATIQAAINAAQATAHGGGGGKGGKGKTAPRTANKSNVVSLDDYRGLLGGLDPKTAEIAGNNLIESITRGLKKGQRTLSNVMDKLKGIIQTKTDALNALLSDKSGFAQSFKDAFSESIFSAQNADAEGNSVAPTLASMKQFAAQQQANAHSLAANIKALLSNGLSKDLISQLVAQGSSGTQQIAALATGTAQDIADFNATNADINQTLSGLGVDLYDALNPNAEAQIKVLTDTLASANRQEALLQRIADSKQEGEIKIKGTDLVITIRKVEQQTGKKLFVASA